MGLKSIQELQQMIERLEERVAESAKLEERVEALEKRVEKLRRQLLANGIVVRV